MAKRPVFIPVGKTENLVEELQVEFEWNPGFAVEQKKKNIAALHKAAKKKGLLPLLEASTKSEVLLGKRLSAFNLKIKTSRGYISIESAYQGSKVFEQGGPYTDIYEKDSRSARQDLILKESGKLIGFDYFGQKWSLKPETAFYDWLYLTALHPHQDYLEKLLKFKGFTDIEFNPKKSIACQARTCALLVSLLQLNLFDNALNSQQNFISIIDRSLLKQNYSAGLLCKNHTRDTLPKLF